jgi:hypothetical protein
MTQWNHLLEAGGGANQRRLPKQENTDQQANTDHCRTIVEDQSFEEGRFVMVVLKVCHAKASSPGQFLLLSDISSYR